MLILNVIVLMAVTGLVGYYLGKGLVTINLVPTRRKRKEIDKKYEQDIKDVVAQYNKALEEINEYGS